MRITFALLAFAAGCVSTSSNYDTMLGELRRDDRASAAADAKVSALETAKSLDRRALIEAVLASNRELAAMREAWRAAVAEVPAAGALDDPMLTYELAPLSIASSSAPFGQRVAVSQKLPFPGKRTLARDAAVADAEAMQADYAAMRIMIAEAASQLYDDAFLNARAFEINDRHRELVTQMQKAAQLRVASGRGSTQDVLQAEVELGHLEHDRVMLETERISITARINGLLHRAPSATLPPAPAELAVPAEPEDVATLERAALQARPQKAAAEARVRAGEANVGAAERAYYPDLELMASYDSMWDMPEHRWMVGVGVEVPLQRGKRAAQVDAARARTAQARAAVEQQTDEIRVEVARAHRELMEAIHVVRLYDDRLLPAARAQVDAALSGFTTGANDFPAVIQAERGLREIQLVAFRARADASRRQATLDRVLGNVAGGTP
jgi:outer membrane protein TolC